VWSLEEFGAKYCRGLGKDDISLEEEWVLGDVLLCRIFNCVYFGYLVFCLWIFFCGSDLLYNLDNIIIGKTKHFITSH
jgi:hypothetical protein